MNTFNCQVLIFFAGCSKNLYFINHCHDEDLIFSTSHKNLFEADFMVNLSAYFVQQGYDYSQVYFFVFYYPTMLRNF